MNVVLDTNVLVSGLMTRNGTCARILDLLVEERFVAFMDNRIRDEYHRVCMRPALRLNPDAVCDFLRFMDDFSEKIVPLPLKVNMPHADDMPFLEVAAAAKAVLITGNTKHFSRKEIGDIQVMTPGDFMEMLRSQ